MTNKLIIFDVDGTLVRTEIALNIAFTATIRKLAPVPFHAFDVSYILDNCFGKTVPEIFDKMNEDAGIKLGQPLRDQIVREYQSTLPEFLKSHLKPDPVLIEALHGLAPHFKMCVGSNGLSKTVGISLATAGLSDTFHMTKGNIFTAENVAHPKPAPDLIIHAAKEMGVEMANVLHIEDSTTGAKAGLAAGAVVLGFTGHAINKEKSAADLKQVGVRHVFDTWQDLASFVLK